MTQRKEISLTAAETSRLVKRQLRKEFPRMVNLSVRVKHFSLRIEWTDGPAEKVVERATACFAGAVMEQNGGDMIKGYKDAAEYKGELVNFGIDFVTCTRTISKECMETINARIATRYAPDTSINQQVTQHRLWEIKREVDASDFGNDTWTTQSGMLI